MANTVVGPTRAEVNREARNYIIEATGLDRSKVTRGDSNDPSPLGLYATVKYMSSRNVNVDSYRYSGTIDPDSIEYSQTGLRDVTFSVQFYRSGATLAAKSLCMYHLTPAGRLFFQKSFLAFRYVQGFDNIDIVMSSQFEDRAVVNLSLYSKDTLTQDIGRINKVPIEVASDLTSTNIEVER